MQTLPIVIDFDVLEHLRLGLFPRDEAFTVYGLDLEAVVPAFPSPHCHNNRLSYSCCTAGDCPQQALMVGRAVLAAAIRMHDDYRGNLAPPQRHTQGITH